MYSNDIITDKNNNKVQKITAVKNSNNTDQELGFDLVTEGTSHLDEQMAYLERELKRVKVVRIQTSDS